MAELIANTRFPCCREWHSKYKDQGLVGASGSHHPEFDYELNLDNLKEAVARNQIEYAVAQDNDGATWRAYHNRYWPTLYLIDKHGRLRYVHIGEGAYSETEVAIQSLLAETEKRKKWIQNTKSAPVLPSEITPESLYLSRRDFIKAAGIAASAALLAACAPQIAATPSGPVPRRIGREGPNRTRRPRQHLRGHHQL